VKATVCRPTELGPAEVGLWREFQVGLGLDNPFLAPEFALTVGEHDRRARVGVVEDGHHIIGFLPFEIGAFRTARTLGEGYSNVQAFVADPRAEWTLPQVVHACGLDLFAFSHLVAAPRPVGSSSAVRDTASLIIDLSGGFDRYAAATRARQPKFIKAIERKRRRLERENPDLRFEFARHDPGAVRQLLAWKSAHYRRTGRRDLLARPEVRDVVEALSETSSPGLRGCVSTLRVGDRLLAVDVSLGSSGVYAGWLSSFDIGAASDSPGAVRTWYVIEAATHAGVRYIDMGPGDEAYKQKLSTGSVRRVEGWVGRPALGTWMHRASHGPVDVGRRFILAHPGLRRLSHDALNGVGRIRERVG
jgi:CelD/BcsL family acetyltransferase involved in cellulose biosynthesis